ncbi:MAG: PD40 domain-containing protein [Candidatus Schekmanbacteria bacterium]|nr:PD40 domain-containing protein [Candidatus Schekmanbacteria bacterium]
MRCGSTWSVLPPALCLVVAAGVAGSPAPRAAASVIGRVSVSSDGTEANGASYPVCLDREGRRAMFRSSATNLDPAAGTGTSDLFVRDRATGETRRVVIRGFDGAEPDNSILSVACSADLDWIAFATGATNLDASDTNGKVDVFRYQRSTSILTRLSVPVTRTIYPEADADSGQALAISGDGQVVAFTSLAGQLTWEDTDGNGMGDTGVDGNGDWDVFVYDAARGRLFLASPRLSDGFAAGYSHASSISSDGRFVSFKSWSPRLVADDTNEGPDIFVLDRSSGTITRDNLAADGSESAYGASGGQLDGGSLSVDGRYLAFASDALNLVDGDTNAATDVFVRDREKGTTERISVASDGTEASESSTAPTISADGRFVVFVSRARELAPTDTYGGYNTFVRDLERGWTWRASRNATGSNVWGDTGGYDIAADGSVALVRSTAPDLVANDNNGVEDVFVTGLPVAVTAIQSVRNRYPAATAGAAFSLVAEKDLVVRAFVRTPADGALVAAEGSLCVDDPVATCPADRLFRSDGIAYPLGTIFSEQQRRSADDSLSFFVRGGRARAALTAGTHAFEVVVAPLGGAGFEPVTVQFTAEFRESKEMDIHVTPCRILDGGGQRRGPNAALLGVATRFLREVYPLERNHVQQLADAGLDVEGMPAASAQGRAQANLELALTLWMPLMASFLVSPVGAEYTFVAGVVPNLVDGVNPIGAPDLPGLRGLTYPALRGVVITLDKDSEPAPDDLPVVTKTLAHEIGHQLGMGEEYCFRDRIGDLLAFPCPSTSAGDATLPFFSPTNSPPQSAAEGDRSGSYITEAMGAFDVLPLVPGRAAVFGPPGDNRYGYMGNGLEVVSWTTQREYEHLFGVLTVPPSRDGRRARVPERPVVALSGRLAQAGTAELEPLLVLNSEAPVPAVSGSGYRVDFMSAGGRRLASTGFDVDFAAELFLAEAEMVALAEVPFGLLLELPAGTDSIRLSDASQQLAQVDRTAHAPGVTIENVAVGASSVDVSWTGTDLDGDVLRYTVLYTPDGGALRTVAAGIEAQAVALAFTEVGVPRAGAEVRVLASDGFDTTVAVAPVAAVPVGLMSAAGLAAVMVAITALAAGLPARLRCKLRRTC